MRHNICIEDLGGKNWIASQVESLPSGEGWAAVLDYQEGQDGRGSYTMSLYYYETDLPDENGKLFFRETRALDRAENYDHRLPADEPMIDAADHLADALREGKCRLGHESRAGQFNLYQEVHRSNLPKAW